MKSNIPRSSEAHTTIGPLKKIAAIKSAPPKLGSVKTRINPRRPGAVAYSAIISPSFPQTEKIGIRYRISHWILGRLERLARARFEIAELNSDKLEDWKQNDGINWIIAQSVNASSEIEGEAVHVDKLELIELPVTEGNGKPVDSELKARIAAIRSIYDAYIWALCRKPEPILSYEFILDLHGRMFSSTKPENAGKIKNKKVYISGGGYHIETLPHEKTAEFLRAICDRFSRNWELSRKHSEYSAFLLIAEFIIDFLAIHPFSDGNGRTARLLSTYLLEKSGYHFARFYPIDYIILETRRDYYQALFLSQKDWFKATEDLTPWVDYYTKTVFTQWLRAYECVKEKHLKGGREKH